MVDSSGNPASGWKIYAYVAGSSTPQNTYTTSAGSVAQSNPIVLNSLGFPTTGQIWLTAGQSYKLTLTDASDVVQKTEDNIEGVNDTSVTIDQWVTSGLTPTYVSATSFTLVGDQTSEFQVGRRLKTTNSGGTVYCTITVSAYTTLTTVTVVNDSGTLDSGLSAVSYGLLTTTNPSTPLMTDAYPIVSGSSDKTKKLRFEVDGLTTATTRVVTPPDEDFTMVGVATAQTLTNKTLTSPVLNTGVSGTAIADASAMAAMTSSTTIVTPSANKIILGTEQATTSGTAKDFTGIPAGVRRITIMFSGVSASGTDTILVQLGDAGGFETSGYVSCGSLIDTAVATSSSTSGFIIRTANGARVCSGAMTLCLEDSASFRWTSTHNAMDTTASTATFCGAGVKALSAELTQIRIALSGSDTFDAGAINIQYER